MWWVYFSFVFSHVISKGEWCMLLKKYSLLFMYFLASGIKFYCVSPHSTRICANRREA